MAASWPRDLEALCRVGASARAAGRAELDITDDDAVAAAFERAEPTVVFNCAAFHNVEVCEREEDRSFEVNARAVKRLAERCAEAGAKLVHLSTNYVFDGTAPEPYGEDDPPNPRSIYAISKLAGEYAALAYAPDALVVRSAGLYGLHGSASKGGNFVTRMVGRAREQGALKMVADQRLSPTFTADLARGHGRGGRRAASPGRRAPHQRRAHAPGTSSPQAIMELAGIEVPVEPATTVLPPGGADRPLNGVLAPRPPSAPAWPASALADALTDYMERAGLLAGAAA